MRSFVDKVIGPQTTVANNSKLKPEMPGREILEIPFSLISHFTLKVLGLQMCTITFGFMSVRGKPNSCPHVELLTQAIYC